ncbi:unnamed protein product [Brassicogethes aeneus]|uniref:MADF domain-containing protein n=1 Tax=Brassicogethes aeneus TaxID=1431903 RepID=A0A9P0AW45_BRAAE|nr:unnamed protein product [Brassicogethes aeneus]
MSALLPKTLKTINSLDLIEEVKKRPTIYDYKGIPNSADIRKKKWEEIGHALYDELWTQLGEREKECLVKEIQIKWKSLRDNYTRILRKEKIDELNGVNNPKKKKYIYYDQLMFLEQYCFSKPTPKIVYVDEIQNSNDSNFDSNSFECEENTLPPGMQQVQFIQIQPSPSVSVSSIKQSPSSTKVDEDGNTRIAKILEEMVNVQKEDKNDDPMGNKKFLLSLLPFMKKLPDDLNLEVRLQIMSVIQSYSAGKFV